MLNEHGYRRKTYDEILTEMENKAKELFGENVKLGNRSVVGILLMIMAWFLSLVWKDNEEVYYSAFVGTATNKNLDRLLPYGGIRRNLAQYALGTISVTGTANYSLPAGFQVATDTDIFFETTEDLILDAAGSGTVEIQSLESGQKGNVAVGAISVIVNPDANVEAVFNAEETKGGRERETDQELRERFGVTVEGLGAATLPAIRAKLLDLPAVRAAAVIENYQSITDEYGRPPHSIQAFVLGGDDQEIAETLFNAKGAGIRPYGDVLMTVTDIAGFVHDVAFSRAEEVYISLRLVVSKNNLFPTDGEAKIKDTLVQFIGGQSSAGALYAGLNMDDDVIYSRLISQIYKVPGIEDVTLSLSNDGLNFIEGNVVINAQQVAQTSSELIEVTVNV